MTAFRVFLAAIFVAISVYTARTIAGHGMDFLSVFFGDIARGAWPGQFNFDFMFMLTLSALWVGWRHRFSAAGLLLAGLALIGGASFLSAYLLIESYRVKGDPRALLLGGRA